MYYWFESFTKEERLEKELNEYVALVAFMKAERGNFNGFEFAEAFHETFNKYEAKDIAESDDKGDCKGVHVGADGVTVYFFCEPENAKKQVRFNRSVYVF